MPCWPVIPNRYVITSRRRGIPVVIVQPSVCCPVGGSNPCTGKTTHRPTRAERPALTGRSPMSARTPRNDPPASGTKTGCLPGSRSKVTPYPHGGATNAAHHIMRRECPIPTGRMEQPPPPDRSVPDETSTAGDRPRGHDQPRPDPTSKHGANTENKSPETRHGHIRQKLDTPRSE
jgi:hypothetical protein